MIKLKRGVEATADAGDDGKMHRSTASVVATADAQGMEEDPDATDPRGDQTNPPASQQGIDGPADAAAAQGGEATARWR